MLRFILFGSAAALAMSTASAQAGGEPGPYGRVRLLPPEIPYRDPTYVPPPPRPVVLAPVFVSPSFVAPRPLSLPLYNEPPPRFRTPCGAPHKGALTAC